MFRTEDQYNEWEKQTLNKLRESGPFCRGQVYETLCSDGLLHEWKPSKHITPTYHKYVCMKCGKVETVDSGGWKVKKTNLPRNNLLRTNVW